MGARGPARRCRREDALAFIVDELASKGASPTYEELAKALGVSKTRARQLVDQLIALGVLEKVPGALRALRIRDVVRARQLLAEFAGLLGWTVAGPLGALEIPDTPRRRGKPCPRVQLPVLPPFEHLPDPD